MSSLGVQINKCLKFNFKEVSQITRVITDHHETAGLSELSTSQAFDISHRTFLSNCRHRIPITISTKGRRRITVLNKEINKYLMWSNYIRSIKIVIFPLEY